LRQGGQGGEGELFLARQFAAAVTALFPVAGAFFVFLSTVSDLHAKDPGSSCAGTAEVAVLSSPIAPWRGAPAACRRLSRGASARGAMEGLARILAQQLE